MSADNWGTCPQCKKIWEADHEKRIREPGQKYGKVPKEEYERLLELAKMGPVETQTLREDFEIGVNEEGIFSASYGCSCEVCGFEYEFRVENKLDLKARNPKESK